MSSAEMEENLLGMYPAEELEELNKSATLLSTEDEKKRAHDEARGRVPVTYKGVLGGILQYAWRNNFVSRLCRVKGIGLRFVLITFILYGLDQGGIHSLNELGRVYFFRDRGYEPAETQRAIAYTDMSWNIKPIFAILMDTMPLAGYHFRSWLLIFGTLGTLSYSLVAVAPNMLSDAMFIFAMWAGMNAVVWNDSALDGATMLKIKEHPAVDTELPSWQQVSLMSCSVIFSLVSGFIIQFLGLQRTYGIVAVISLCATVAGVMLPDPRTTQPMSLRRMRASFISILSCFKNKWYYRIFIYQLLSSLSFDLNGLMIFWYNDVAHFSKGFQGAIIATGWIVALVAVVVNATFCKHVQFRTIFAICAISQAFISSLDLLLVCVAKDHFWGHFIALSDRAALKAAGKLKFIITMVAVSEYTPPGGETTATALLAAAGNFAGGDFLGPVAGSWLIDGLQIKDGDYTNLPWAILVRSLIRLLPLPFIPFLIPRGSSYSKKAFVAAELHAENAAASRAGGDDHEYSKLDDIELAKEEEHDDDPEHVHSER